jgi:hypothetical protein
MNKIIHLDRLDAQQQGFIAASASCWRPMESARSRPSVVARRRPASPPSVTTGPWPRRTRTRLDLYRMSLSQPRRRWIFLERAERSKGTSCGSRRPATVAEYFDQVAPARQVGRRQGDQPCAASRQVDWANLRLSPRQCWFSGSFSNPAVTQRDAAGESPS